MTDVIKYRPSFVNTKNTDTIVRLAKEAVKTNSWLVVEGEVGDGKTFMFNQIKSLLEAKKNKHIIVNAGPVWESSISGISIPFIARHMIRAIRPAENIPGNQNERYFRLRDLLLWVEEQNRKVVLVIDEAQALRWSGFRDLKKLWELSSANQSHLFSIIMFMKPETRLSGILDSPEIGHRVFSFRSKPLTRVELLSIAEQGFNIKFPQGKTGEKTKELFYSNLSSKNPLSVENLIKAISFSYPEFQKDGVVRESYLRNVISDGIRTMMERLRISKREIRRRIQDDYGKDFDNRKIEESLFHPGKNPKDESIAKSSLDRIYRERTGKKSPVLSSAEVE